MIIRKKHNWFLMLFVWQGSVLKDILPRLLFLFVLSILVLIFKGQIFNYKIPLNPAPFTLVGIALAIFLGFCNSTAYDRYWEGRKLWGALLIDCRSLTRQAISLTGLPTDSVDVRKFTSLLVALSHSLRHQLRGSDSSMEMARLLPQDLAKELSRTRYQPVLLLTEMGVWVKKMVNEGKLDSITQTAIDQNLDKVSGIVGGCERIASNPIPYAYSVLLHRTVYVYCLLLPFGLVDSTGWMMPVLVLFISYTFIALEAIVREIEDPFGTEPNDLPLTTICETIENSLLEMTGQPLRTVTVPKDHISN